ncbi:hypothetical protein [Pseudoclavibacter sp. Z016]|uniref:hypothetical protein n=1 Tax=Pseudoclavibacter sp. Z016 TaxID=2080581 RepID=UPI0011AFFB03|nr:hypothetical protein [Pseudoclavibacter sp. Z016]
MPPVLAFRSAPESSDPVLKILGADWWDALSAVGTVSAVAVALLLSLLERHRARRAERALDAMRETQAERLEQSTAAMVSAWIEIKPTPARDGRSYDRVAIAHVQNQSDRPVFNLNACVALKNAADRWTPLGSMSIPMPIPTLAARSSQTWDLTGPLRAWSYSLNDLAGHPTIGFSFTDLNGIRWTRDFDSKLDRQGSAGDAALYMIDDDHAQEQLGDLGDPLNPFAILITFRAALSRAPEEGGPDLSTARLALDPAAGGWKAIHDTQLLELATSLSGLGVAAHVHYPAPRIAYIKMLSDEATHLKVTSPGYVEVPMTIVTLRFASEVGWRIFSIGPLTPVDRIEFPEGDLRGMA